MSISTLKIAGFVFLFAFGVFLGVDLSSRGIERINGPLLAANHGEAVTAADSKTVAKVKEANAHAADVEASRTVSQALPLIREQEAKRGDLLKGRQDLPKSQIQETAMNRAANKFGGLLQITADHLIRWVVSFFDGLFS